MDGRAGAWILREPRHQGEVLYRLLASYGIERPARE
jgi:hypothetical protein